MRSPPLKRRKTEKTAQKELSALSFYLRDYPCHNGWSCPVGGAKQRSLQSLVQSRYLLPESFPLIANPAVATGQLNRCCTFGALTKMQLSQALVCFIP